VGDRIVEYLRGGRSDIAEMEVFCGRRSDIAATALLCRTFREALSDERLLTFCGTSSRGWPDLPRFLCYPAALEFSRDRSRLAAIYDAVEVQVGGDRRNFLAVYDKTAGLIEWIELLSTSSHAGFQVEFSPDGRRLLLLDHDGGSDDVQLEQGEKQKKQRERKSIRIFFLPPIGEKDQPQVASSPSRRCHSIDCSAASGEQNAPLSFVTSATFLGASRKPNRLHGVGRSPRVRMRHPRRPVSVDRELAVVADERRRPSRVAI